MGFLSSENLKEKLGPEKYQELQQGAIDKGAAFLDGQITSSMNKIMSDKTMTGLTKTATLGAGFYAIGDSLIKDQTPLADLATSITTVAVDTASQEIGKIAGKIAGKIVSIPTTIPNKLLQYTTEAFNANKKTFGEILSEVMAEQGKQSDENQEKQDAEEEKKTKETTIQKLNKAKDKLTEKLDMLNSYLGIAANYIEEGPDYIARELDKQITRCVDEANKAVDDQIKEVEKGVDDECRKQGEKKGKRMAEIYNNTLKKQAETQLAKQKTVISKAKALAFKAKQVAILQVMSITGINVPI